MVLSELCERVYDDNPVRDASKEKFISAAATQVLVVELDDYIAVVFRGTDELMDWKTNLGLGLVPFRDHGRVHAGFYDAAFRVKYKLINELKFYDKPIVCTGHSAGGAQAVIFAVMVDGLLKVKAVTTFGQPRVGDAEFINYASAKFEYTRVTNQCDVVCNSPPNYGWFGGYVHAGKELVFNKDGYLMPETSNRQSACNFIKNRLAGMVPNFITHTLDQHSINVYIANCKLLFEK